MVEENTIHALEVTENGGSTVSVPGSQREIHGNKDSIGVIWQVILGLGIAWGIGSIVNVSMLVITGPFPRQAFSPAVLLLAFVPIAVTVGFGYIYYKNKNNVVLYLAPICGIWWYYLCTFALATMMNRLNWVDTMFHYTNRVSFSNGDGSDLWLYTPFADRPDFKVGSFQFANPPHSVAYGSALYGSLDTGTNFCLAPILPKDFINSAGQITYDGSNGTYNAGFWAYGYDCTPDNIESSEGSYQATDLWGLGYSNPGENYAITTYGIRGGYEASSSAVKSYAVNNFPNGNVAINSTIQVVDWIEYEYYPISIVTVFTWWVLIYLLAPIGCLVSCCYYCANYDSEKHFLCC